MHFVVSQKLYVAGEEGVKVLRMAALSAWHTKYLGMVRGQTPPKPSRSELVILTLASAQPLSSSSVSIQSDCKVLADWQDFTITSHSCK